MRTALQLSVATLALAITSAFYLTQAVIATVLWTLNDNKDFHHAKWLVHNSGPLLSTTILLWVVALVISCITAFLFLVAVRSASSR